MELLDEYQQALKKIKNLEEQLEAYKESVDMAEAGVKAVLKMLRHHAAALNDGEDDPRFRRFTDSVFGTPSNLCEMVATILRMPEMTEPERDRAKREVAMRGLDMVKDRLSSYAEDEE